jgi:hypothetical protein
MKMQPDPLERLRLVWTIALNRDALRLLREAVTAGGFERKRTAQITGRTDLTRTSPGDLADRLADLGLLTRKESERRQGRPVFFLPTDLAEAVVGFIDEHLGVSFQQLVRPSLVLLDEHDRALLEKRDLELYDVLTRSAVDIASLRPKS